MNILADLKTPCLLLDEGKMRANQDRMMQRVKSRSCNLRPHLKTLKSISAARYVLGGTDSPITVSTLKEAQEFGRAGFKDILYAVAITPQKLDQVVALRREGIDLKLLIELIGTDGNLLLEHTRLSFSDSDDPNPVESKDYMEGLNPVEAHQARFTMQANAMLDAVEGKPCHLATLEEANVNLKLALAAKRSWTERKIITLDN